MTTDYMKQTYFNTVCRAKLVPDDVQESYHEAMRCWQTDKVEQIQDEYVVLYLEAKKKLGEFDELTKEDIAAFKKKYNLSDEPRTKRTKNSKTDTTDKKPKDPNEVRATHLYKQLSRTLKYGLLKEETLLRDNHTCQCCNASFSSKSTFKAMHPLNTYPLYVRCVLPLVKYIQAHQFTTVQQLLADERVIMNPDKYLSLCDSCQPMRFKKK